MSEVSVTSDNSTDLSNYIRETLYKNWQNDREPLEKKWQKNLDAFSAVSNGVWKKGEGQGWRSDTFILITKIKTITAYSLVLDMLLQDGKIPFSLVPSPWDEVVMEDLPPEQQEQIEDAISDMTGLIHQQFCDCHADRQMMKCIMSKALYGETFAKRFVHDVSRTGFKAQSLAPEGMEDPQGKYTRWEKFSTSVTYPAWEYVSVWDIFRDLEADIQDGKGIIHRDTTDPYTLRKMKGQPYVLDEAVENAIKAAPKSGENKSDSTATLQPGQRDIKHRGKTIERLEFWGRVPKRVASDFESHINKKESFVESDQDFEDDGNEVEIYALMAGEEVVKYVRNTGDRPFYMDVWEVKLDHVENTGVPDNLEDTQTVLNGAVRALEDNEKLISNLVVATKSRFLEKGAMKDWEPGKEIAISDDCDDVRQAIQQITFQDITAGLVNVINLFERYADEASQLPKIMQGEVALKKQADTLGEMQMLQQNAGKYLGGVIKNTDERLIEPMVQSFYEYNMEDPELTKGKGNFIAKALGFTSFQDRAVKSKRFMQLLSIILSNEALAAEVKLGELLNEVYKILEIDPAQTKKSREEKQAEQEQKMQMMEQAKAEAKQAIEEEFQRDVAKEEAKHQFDMQENDQKLEHDLATNEQEHRFTLAENEQKFRHDLVKEDLNADSNREAGQSA